MPTDLTTARRVAWLALALTGPVACGPAVRPGQPPGEPSSVAGPAARPVRASGGRQLVLGEMCPQAAGGRAAVTPLMMRTVSWIDAAEEVAATIERGSVPRLTVLGSDGKVAGVFDTVGIADVGMGQQVAAGAYVGASPCTAEGAQGARVEDPACVPATGGCGVAIGEITRPDDPPPRLRLATGGACLQGDAIAVDIDVDGVPELFPLASALDPIRGPAQEWSAAPTVGAACAPTFRLHDIRLVRPPEPGKPVDAKSLVVLDVLGVIDLDGDGRHELVTALRFATARTILVYSAAGSAQRLELVGEGAAFDPTP